jgi:hypothetical protein
MGKLYCAGVFSQFLSQTLETDLISKDQCLGVLFEMNITCEYLTTKMLIVDKIIY